MSQQDEEVIPAEVGQLIDNIAPIINGAQTALSHAKPVHLLMAGSVLLIAGGAWAYTAQVKSNR